MLEHQLKVPEYAKVDGTWTEAKFNIVFGDDIGGVSSLYEFTIYKGDANGDNTVDVADIATIITYMAGYTEGIPLESVDANEDGAVDVADIVYVISIMAAKARLHKSLDE